MTLFSKARTRILVGGALLVFLTLSACGGSASAEPSTNPQDSPSTEPIVEVDAMKAFREVLLRNSNYRDAECGEMLSIDQWFELGETVECEAQNYTVFDLDDDGTSEIILNMDVRKVKDYGNTVRLCPMGIQRVVTGLRDRSTGSVLLGLLLGIIPPTDKRVAGSGGSGEGAVWGAGGDILTALATGTAVGVERNLDGGTAATAALRRLQNILALAQDARLGSVLPVAVEVAESDLTSDRPPAFSHFNLGTVVGPDHGRVATGGAHDISRFQSQTGKAGRVQHPAREFIFIFPGVDLSGGDFHSGQQKPQEQGKAVALYRVGELIRRTLTSARTVRHSPIRSGQLIWANASIPVCTHTSAKAIWLLLQAPLEAEREQRASLCPVR